MVGGAVTAQKKSHKNQPDVSVLPNFQFSGTGQSLPEDRDYRSEDSSPTAEDAPGEGKTASTVLQKRRRVTRACDECRRKKIKCDGKQPCTHCTVYSYECTYDQPSNRRRNPTPQYIEALEARLQRAEALLKVVLPDVDLNDANVLSSLSPDLASPSKSPRAADVLHKTSATLAAAAAAATGQGRDIKQLPHTEAERDSLLESMVKDTGSLDIDDQGHSDFHGHSSGVVFLQRLRQQFGDMLGNSEGLTGMLAKPPYFGPTPRAYESPQSSAESPFDFSGTAHADLPPKGIARQLCDLSMSDACSLMRFMHKPTFWTMFNRMYDTPPESWGVEENRYLPLLYALLAVGTRFAKDEHSQLQREGYLSGLDDGFKWFRASRQMMDITDCRDIPSLQAVVCMIMFLQSTAKLSTCWCYIGIALHSAIRMGLHRSIPGKFNYVELELRRRLFWQIRKMDVYVGAMIGLPTMLSEDDFDQDHALDIDDEFITPLKILPSPPEHIHLVSGSNAQTRLLTVLRKVIKYVYPVRGVQYLEGKPRSYVVSHAKIREIERDLQHWMEELPMYLRPGGDVSPELARVQQLLRMAYAYVQMFLYRPFLHYVSRPQRQMHVDKRSYACAAACVSVSRNVIHITQEMTRRGLLIGSFWFTMYTTFLAIMALVFFALENAESKASEDIMKDARTGKAILAKLAKGSMAADRCTQTLDLFFEKLPERLRHSVGVSRSSSSAVHSSKRKSVVEASSLHANARTSSNSASATPEPGVQRAATFPQQASGLRLGSIADTASFPNRAGASYFDATYLHDSGFGKVPHGTDTFSTPESVVRDQNGGGGGGGGNMSHFHASSGSGGGGGGLSVPGYNIPDLSAIMFSSTDPFAYPNQPMMTLEEQAGFRSVSPQASNSSNTPNRNVTATLSSSPQINMYGNNHNNNNNNNNNAGRHNSLPRGSLSNGSGLEAQLLDPLQPYLTVDYGQMADGSGRAGGDGASGVFNAEMGLGIDECDMSGLVKEDGSGNEQLWWGQGIDGSTGMATGPDGWAI